MPVTNKVLVVVNPTTPISSLKVEDPVMLNVSSIIVVPPAESIVKLPDEVSISLSPVTPICILSTVAPPFASIEPVNVEIPVTANWSSIVIVPPAESIVRLPVDVSISLSPVTPI